MKSRKIGWLVLAAVASLPLSSCQRSPAFKKDQEYFKNDPASYYSNKTAKPATQRVESLGQPKKRLFVLNFWNDSPVKLQDAGAFAAEELKRGLFATQRVILPTDTRSDFSTGDFVEGDKSLKVDQLIREGRRMGVAVLVVGRIPKVVFRQRGDEVGLLRQKQSLAAVDVELKVFDVVAGREIAADSRSGEASANSLVALEGGASESASFRAELTKLAIREAVVQLVPSVMKAVEKMTWQGRIAKVTGPRIYVNAGRASGLVAGDILKAMTAGEDIYDPTTGALLGRSQGTLKGTMEVIDFIGTDGAVAQVHTGGNFQEGDLVQLY